MSDGTSGNMYLSMGSKPNTATLTLPTQYTASGVGSAIPVSALGEWSTYTTTIPGTILPPVTIAAHVLAASIVSGSTVVPATTTPATTVPATTIAPQTSVLTTKIADAVSSHTSVAGTSELRSCFVLQSCLLIPFLACLIPL